MGEAQTRCEAQARHCVAVTDKQCQLKCAGWGRQAYAPFDLDPTDSERLPELETYLADQRPPDKGAREPCALAREACLDRCCSLDAAPAILDAAPAMGAAAAKEGAAKDLKLGVPHWLFSGSGGDVPIEMLVDIDKGQPGRDLGLKVLHKGVGVLVVADIRPGGAIEAANQHNARNRAEVLEVGDEIAMVNGVGGDDAAMVEECKKAQHLMLRVRRVRRGRRPAQSCV